MIALLGSVLVFSPSNAAVSGSISGTVTGPDGPIDADVELYVLDEGMWLFSDFASADAGSYTFPDVAAGTYRIRFDHEDLANEFFDNSPTLNSADDIDVDEGEAVTGIDAQLAVAGRIGGIVKRPGGTPLPDVDVVIYQLVGSTFEQVETDGDDAERTNADGEYTVKGLQPGTYRVEFHDTDGEYASEFNGNSSTLADAPNITVVSGRKASAGATLARGGTMTGTLRSPSGQPLQGMYVTAYRIVGSQVEPYGLTDGNGENASTNAAGQYKIGGLPTGTFRLRFDDFDDQHYGTEYFDDRSTLETADDIVVTAGQVVSGLDAELVSDPAPPGPGISGTVVAGNGSPLEGIEVTATGDGSCDCVTVTAADGTYFLPVEAGEYLVYFSDPSGEYLQETFDNNSEGSGLYDSVTVEDDVRAGVDARLSRNPAARITGTVTLPGGAPARGVNVRLYIDEGTFFDSVKNTQTRSNGTYVFGGLDPGTYRLGFFPDDDETYAREFYSNARTVGSARNIVVGEGRTVAGKDAQLAKNGSVSGTVTTPDGKPVSNVFVVAANAPNVDGDDFYELHDQTNRDGKFVITTPPGTYRLAINNVEDDYDLYIASKWTGEFYDDSSTLAGSDDFSVKAGRKSPGLNIVLGYFEPPTNITATSVTSTSVTLGWMKTDGVFMYKVRYSPTTPGPAKTVTVGDVDGTEVTGLSPGVEYEFKVAAYLPEHADHVQNAPYLDDRLSRYSPTVEATTSP